MHRLTRSRPGRALAAMLVASTLIAAACGSDDDDPDSSGTPSSAPSSTDDTSTSPEPTDSSAPATTPDDGLGPEDPATLAPVKVGLIVPEGGPFDVPATGDAGEAAAEYANQYLGGLGGHEIEIVRCSDKSDGVSATACANQMVEEGVAVVATASAIPGADQIVPIVTGAGIPYVGVVGASTAELTTAGTYFWTAGALAVLGGEAQYAKDQGITSVHYFLIDNPAAIGAITTIGQAAYDAAGVELRFTPVPIGTADATPLVTAALADDPGAVAFLTDPSLCTSLLGAINTAGSTVPRMLNELCASDAVRDALGQDGLDGSLVFRTADFNDNDEADLFEQVMQEYAPDVDRVQGSPGYMTVLGLVRAVNDAGLTGDPTPASITAAIQAATDVPIPLAGGLEMSCGTNAIPLPILKTVLCSSGVVVERWGPDGVDEVLSVDPAPLFGGAA